MKTTSSIFLRSKHLFKAGVLLIFSIGATMPAVHAQTVLWSQNFDAGGTPADYVGTGANKFDAISTSGAGLVWSINGSDQLQVSRTADTGAATRNTDVPLGDVQAGFLRLDFNATAVTTPTSGFGYAFHVAVGNGMSTNNFLPQPGQVFAEFGFSTIEGTQWTIRNIAGGTYYTPYFSGLQTVTLVFNNSGSGQSYNFGDGVAGITANDTFDLWVGTALIYSNAAVTLPGMTADITDFKLTWNTSQATLVFDNISYGSIPEPSTSLLFLGGIGVWLLRRSFRRRT